MNETGLIAASVLSHDPPIFYVRPRPRPFGLAGLIAERFGGRPSVCIVRTMWSLESPVHMRQLAGQYRQFTALHRQMRLVIAANTPHEVAMLARRGIDAVLANHNIFVDETIFRPLPEVAPIYDAVYYAAEHKSDPLAALVATRAHLPHHRFFNPVTRSDVRRLTLQQVNHVLAQSRVGLCLSAMEGAMTASMEYLLAGLPVITTPSLGRRSRYFHRDTAIRVHPDPRQIRDVVELLKARKIPRDFVRAKTLELMRRDRSAFNDFIAELRAGFAPMTGDPRWAFRYVNNLYEWRSVEEFAAQLGLAPHRQAAE